MSEKPLDFEREVQLLVWVLRSMGVKKIPVAEHLYEFTKMICNSPEAQGKIAFNEKRGMLLLMDRDD